MPLHAPHTNRANTALCGIKKANTGKPVTCKRCRGVAAKQKADTRSTKQKAPKAKPDQKKSAKTKPIRRRGTTDCLCGCGQKTPRQFRQGHDQKLISKALKGPMGQFSTAQRSYLVTRGL